MKGKRLQRVYRPGQRYLSRLANLGANPKLCYHFADERNACVPMRTSDFDYELPPELIAQAPVEPRDASRLLVMHRDTGRLEHRVFRDLVEYLRPGDLLIANDSRVIPARLFARKRPTGGRVELLLLNRRDERTWEVLVGGKRVRPGTQLELVDAASWLPETSPVTAEVVADLDGPRRLVRFDRAIEPLLPELGETPLPPYVHQALADPERYQTIYARIDGSAAAPTAGLHFTPELMLELRDLGVEFAFVTLHIGLDTFKPVTEDQVEAHPMHTEWCELSEMAARQVNQARLAGRRVIAVGTTAVRVLETAALVAGDQRSTTNDQRPTSFVVRHPSFVEDSERSNVQRPTCNDVGRPWQIVSAFTGPTDLFIYPGFKFRVVDALITNFHLPRSTLLMLVSAFAGRELIFRAYQAAIRERYRFYSFGDASLIL
jgi:S-adenosylmethionine:tRNA ribosyltransferase-isomerase